MSTTEQDSGTHKRVRQQCHKRKFRDEISAKIALANIRSRDNPNRYKMECRVYKCSKCKGWHLTSMPNPT